MMKQKKLRAGLLSLIVFLMAAALQMDVHAAQGSVVFGSEAYSWYLEEYSPIGIYMISDVPIGSYEICLEYDPAVLEYQDGATEIDGNQLYIRGTGTDTRYKTMLHFIPKAEGTTKIQVISVSAYTVGDVSNNVVSEELEITEIAMAPIEIKSFISNEVADIRTSPVALTGFSKNIRDYSLTVGPEVEKLTIEYDLEDERAVATLSDTSLEIGENTITLTVNGDDGNHVYTFHVTREEPMLPPEPVQSPEKSEPPVEESKDVSTPDVSAGEKLSHEGGVSGDRTGPAEGPSPQDKPDLLLGIGIVLAAFLAVVYMGMLINKKKAANADLPKQENGKHLQEELQIIDLEQTVIDIQDVTMRFRLAQDEASSLKEFMIRTIKGQNKFRTLTALNHIRFDIKQGDVVGIIGTNGSGKSTLLKIVSGALNPSEGKVIVDRSKVQMLTLGTGFDMELTARENVYLNGAIIGYTKEYIEEKYDEIVAFAELEGFMDERMKNFSSGMVSRLGFAIATMRDTPDILILDEVLSVGDMFFRKKSETRIREMIHSGATVIIVSHSMDTIQKNCNKVVWIEKGNMKMIGTPEEVCGAYRKLVQ